MHFYLRKIIWDIPPLQGEEDLEHLSREATKTNMFMQQTGLQGCSDILLKDAIIFQSFKQHMVLVPDFLTLNPNRHFHCLVD